MPGYKQLTEELSSQVNSALKTAQDLSIEVISSVASTVGEYIPQVNVAPVRPEEVVEANFGIVDELVANQKSYAQALLKALEPITSKFVEQPKAKKVAAA
jgi:hypothetical protein